MLPELDSVQPRVRDDARLLQEDLMHRAGANGALTPDEWTLVNRNEYVSCIRQIRERTGLGLRDSKANSEIAKGDIGHWAEGRQG